MNNLIVILALLLFSSTAVKGQSKLVLEHNRKSNKKRYIEMDREYYIKTTDTSFYSQILSFTETTLSVTGKWIKTNRDTSYTITYSISKHRDTTITITRPLYRRETVVILFSDIQVITKDWFKKRDWLTIFGDIGFGAVLAVPLLPVAAIDKGAKGVKNWLLFEGILLAIATPPLIIGSRHTKYDLIRKWTIKTED
jgi:hypothetical protein